MPTTLGEIRLCSLDELLEFGAPLFREHWEEVALNKDVMQLKLHELRYRGLEQQDFLFILGAFEDFDLIGYSVNLVANHLHYADLCYCANDALYVSPRFRRSAVGLRLMQRTEREATERGAELMQWHAKPATTLERILDHSADYDVQDLIYTRRL